MTLRNLVGIGVFGITLCVLCGTADANRGISTDGWGLVDMGTGSSVTFPVGGTSIMFAPGASGAFVENASGNDRMWVWGGIDSTAEQVVISPNSAGTQFEIDFNYGQTSCGTETATLDVGATMLSAGSPCSAGMVVDSVRNGGTEPIEFNHSSFMFALNSSGQFQLQSALPQGWSVAAVSAPEMDPNSAIVALTLLLGGVAVAVGRRKLPSVANQA